MSRESCEIVDTYPDFTNYWKTARLKDLDEQIRLWKDSYMKRFPALLRKQIQCYEADGIDWKGIAKKILPLMPQRLPMMGKARDKILSTCGLIYEKASEKLGFDFRIVFIIYVGLGCGAGWATTYNKQPSILLGLENIAEEGWCTKGKIEGLLCHEIGHLVHMKWRNQWAAFEIAAEDPVFRLYEEGFGQRCEHIVRGKETWHMKPDREWLAWCGRHRGWLAKEFLTRLERQASVNDFFGSWFNIEGKKQTGYFLGHEFIKELQKTLSLRKIALLSAQEVRILGIKYLSSICG